MPNWKKVVVSGSNISALNNDTNYLAAASNLSDVANTATARSNLGAAKLGTNTDITSLSGLTTAISPAQGGTGLTELGGANTFLTVNGEEDGLEFSTITTSGVVTTSGNQSIAGDKTFTDKIIMKNGTLASPGIGFSDGNGFFKFLSDTIGVTIGSTLVAYWDNSSTNSSAYSLSSGVQLRLGGGGTDSRPDLIFSPSETDTGFYRSGADEISISRTGTQAFKFDANGFQQLVAGGTSQFAGHLQAHCLGIGGSPPTTSGEIFAYGDITANKSSDKRLKKKIKNIKNPLDKLSKINGVTFEWKKTDEKMKREVHSHEGPDVGVIAQEIEEILPEIVATRDNGYKAVYYEKLIPLLIESVKELKAEVDELKKSK